ncbi:anti-sigma factor family protein [Streptomyces sp. NPDC050418]|uniref:anti-sigma factor family protein n=1 Tax=Streptomyces sp. NPDC050418 TaxID=3365612 RepID=UPI00379EA03B
MTSTTGTADTAEHPEVSELSDLAEGLLTPSRTAAVRRHLDGCAECADVQASLEELQGLLGSLPVEARMPDEVAARIDAALAAEVPPLDVSRETVSAVSQGDASRPDVSQGAVSQGAVSQADVSRETSAGEAAIVGIQRPAGHPRGATGPGRGGAPRRRRRVAAVTLGALAAVAVVGLGTLVLLPENGEGPTTQAAEKFSGDPLEERVATLLHARTSSGGESPPGQIPPEDGSPSVESNSTSPRIKDVPSIPECIARGIDRDEPPLAGENGTYKGTQAFLVVMPHASEPGQVSAYVVDASCLKQDQSTARGKVLLETAYPRN